MLRSSELLAIASQLAEKRTTINDIYPGKIIYTETEREMATINSHLDLMKVLKDMQHNNIQNGIYQQQSLMAQQAQNQMSRGLAGLGNGYGQQMGGLGSLSQHLIENKYPGLTEAFHGVLGNPKIKAVAEEHGFVLDFDSDSYKHPNGGFVNKRMLEDIQGTGTTPSQLFNRAKSPNTYWLDDRIEEIRVKL